MEVRKGFLSASCDEFTIDLLVFVVLHAPSFFNLPVVHKRFADSEEIWRRYCQKLFLTAVPWNVVSLRAMKRF